MEVSKKIHVPAALPTGKETAVKPINSTFHFSDYLMTLFQLRGSLARDETVTMIVQCEINE
jgi:hypothetical protein